MDLKKVKKVKEKKHLKLKSRSFCGEATYSKLIQKYCFGQIEMIVMGLGSRF